MKFLTIIQTHILFIPLHVESKVGKFDKMLTIKYPLTIHWTEEFTIINETSPIEACGVWVFISLL